MLIGYDASRAFLPDKTGTENYSYQLLKHLSLIDTENDYLIYTRPGSKIPGYNLVITGSPIKSGMTKEKDDNYGWPSNFKFRLLNYQRLWTQIGLSRATFEDKLDLLFVPAHTLPLTRPKDLKTVITVHDLGAEYLPKMHQLKQVLYLKFMTHHQLASATKIIAVSEATKQDLVKRVGISSGKISVIHEGVDKNIFKPMAHDTVKKVLSDLDIEYKNFFLFVGTIQPRKNLKTLIESFNLFLIEAKTDHPPKLIIVGGKGWGYAEIFSLPKHFDIDRYVHFIGRIPNEKLAALYNGATALTYPSLFEGFGLPILESMACGTPVITSNTSSMPEVAGSAALLVNPKSEQEISQAMLKIYTNDSLSSRMTESGYKQVDHFSWEKTARETLRVFKETNGT